MDSDRGFQEMPRVQRVLEQVAATTQQRSEVVDNKLLLPEQAITWGEDEEGNWSAFVKDDRGKPKKVIWAPQPGSQEAFLACPVYEVLYEGTRGPGKTDALLMDFSKEVGEGWGAEWTGLLFRQSYPQLRDVIRKTHKWFHQIWPKAKYNETKHTWTWPTGESLILCHGKRVETYWDHHGSNVTWIGWEELCNWADPALYLKMMSVCRSTVVGMPCRIRATANPYGPGHNWVKDRWRLPVAMNRVIGPVIRDSLTHDGEIEKPRVAIHGHLTENRIMLHAQPDYVGTLRSAANSPAELRAWLHGDWDIVAGGMFDDLWRANIHVVPNLPWGAIPASWRIDRSYDHGQSKPFSVGWWAESNGEAVEWNGRLYGQVRGDLYRISEWYGWNGQPNRGVSMLATDIAQGIRDRQQDWGIDKRTKPGPADGSIYNPEANDPRASVAKDMAAKPFSVVWTVADKARKQGWQQMRKLLRGAMPSSTGIRETPGLFVFERCTQFIRTVPALCRNENDPDDVDTDTEDHIGDEVRYRCRPKSTRPSQRYR